MEKEDDDVAPMVSAVSVPIKNPYYVTPEYVTDWWEVLGKPNPTTEAPLPELRRSRRLAGLPPSPIEMSQEQTSAASTPSPTGSVPYYRVPPNFGGTSEEDVDVWLKNYKRVSRSNGWDSEAQLRHVVFSLTDTALMWYENHEDMFTTWDRFVEEVQKCFGDSDSKKKRAEQTLAQRAQLPGETCTTYIEEILKLCKIVNTRMSEEDKVGHVLKGIAEDVYNFLIGKESLNSVSDVMKHCRTFESLKMRRISPKFGRLSNVPTVASVETVSPNDLAFTIRQIVREELLRCQQTSHHPNDFQDAYAREPERARTPAILAPWQPSVNAADPDEYRGTRQSGFSRRTPPTYGRRFRSPGYRQRTSPGYGAPEERHYYSMPSERSGYSEQPPVSRPHPVCYNCGVPGHIARFCNHRNPYQRQPAQPFDRPLYTPRPPRAPTGFRYPSPASDRSLTPPPAPRSPSPRRRTRSPPPEN